MAWERVPKDASEHFYKAQFNIGGAYYKLGETDEAVAVWKNIPESASEQYEMAQTNLSIIAENQEKPRIAAKPSSRTGAPRTKKNLPNRRSRVTSKARKAKIT